MKRIIAFILSFLLLPTLWGCQEKETFQTPVAFYYQAGELDYHVQCTAIRSEIREGAEYTSLAETVNVYLQGPESQDLQNPFPIGLRLVSAEIRDDTLYLTLSDHLGTLSGLPLTMACSCLVMTSLELTGVTNVNIRTENQLLDGEKSITINRENLGLLDEAKQNRSE